MTESQPVSTFEDRIKCLITFFNFTHVTQEHLKLFFISPNVSGQKKVFTRKRKMPSVVECNFSKSDMQIFFKYFSFLSFEIDADMFMNYEKIKRHGFRDVKWILFEPHVKLTGNKEVIMNINQSLNIDILCTEEKEKDFKLWCNMEEPMLTHVLNNELNCLMELFIISGNKIKSMRSCDEEFIFEKTSTLFSYYIFHKLLCEKNFFEMFHATLYVLNKKVKVKEDCPLLCLMISTWKMFWKV